MRDKYRFSSSRGVEHDRGREYEVEDAEDLERFAVELVTEKGPLTPVEVVGELGATWASIEQVRGVMEGSMELVADGARRFHRRVEQDGGYGPQLRVELEDAESGEVGGGDDDD